MEELLKSFEAQKVMIDQINDESQRMWGAMTPQHMIEHIGGLIYANSQGLGMPEVLKGEKALKAKARFFNSYLPFEKNVPIPGMSVKLSKLRYSDINEAKQKTFAAIDRFSEYVLSHPTFNGIHAYFGPLSSEEWVQFHINHIQHHLMQFGILHRDEKIKQLEKLIYKISTKVTKDTPSKWGKMSAHQMIEHLGLTFLVSTGKFNLKYEGSEEEALELWNKFKDSDNPWIEVLSNVNIGTPRPVRRESMEDSKKDMALAFKKYMEFCIANPEAVNPHLALGNLDIDQWRQVHVKHLIHHGRQFGLEL